MATLASDTPPPSPRLNFRRKSWARRLERCCCQTLSYFPLSFIYGLTTWAVYVEINVSFWTSNTWTAYFSAALGVALYLLANTSYTIAVFTTPGSTLDPRQDWRDRGVTNPKRTPYSALPTTEHDDDDLDVPHSTHNIPTLTAKSSTGKPRYCKKCRTTKPDRCHHCSTCGRCVLKMDHHCPWLATCVGLHNYKAFLLFLTYTSLFCWLCFMVSGTWVWTSISDAQQMQEGLKIVNAILLAVLGGIIGLVLTGFTGWHIYLAVSGQTTIESLEKTRYLSPLRRHMEPDNSRNYIGDNSAEGSGEEGEQQQSLLEHLKETHANALPGILRPEEGEASRSHTPNPSSSSPSNNNNNSSSSPAHHSLQSSYASMEAQRERSRYLAYQDELDSAKLPNAFDLGWKRNLLHVLGHKPLFWFLPVCNTGGDGWVWDISPLWTEASAEVARERAARGREEEMWAREGRQGVGEPERVKRDLRWTPGQGFVDRAPEGFHRDLNGYAEGEAQGEGQVLMQPLDRRKAPPRVSSRNGGHAHVGGSTGVGGGSEDVDSYDTSSDEDVQQQQRRPLSQQGTSNWNDIPDDFLSAGRANRSHSRGRRKGD